MAYRTHSAVFLYLKDYLPTGNPKPTSFCDSVLAKADSAPNPLCLVG